MIDKLWKTIAPKRRYYQRQLAGVVYGRVPSPVLSSFVYQNGNEI